MRGGRQRIVKAEQEEEPINGLFYEGNPNSSETSWKEEDR
jgi:hypothetical protein